MRKSKQISTVRVGGEDARIVWAEGLYREHSALGMVNHDTKTIFLDDGIRISKMRTFKVLMHEMLHLIEGFMSVSLDEDTLDRIAQGMAVALVESNIVDLEGVWFGDKKPSA